MSDLNGRLQHLERSLRRLKYVVVALCGGLLIVAAISFDASDDSSDVVQARAFVVAGEDGTEVGRFAAYSSESIASLTLNGQDGTPRVILSTTDTVSSLLFWDSTPQLRLSALVKGERLGFYLWDETGQSYMPILKELEPDESPPIFD